MKSAVYSQRQLATAADMSYGTLANYETRPSNPRQDQVKRLAKTLEVTEGQKAWIAPKAQTTARR